MSYAYPSTTREQDRSDDHDRGYDERHPALTPLVIDVIPDQTRAELEESIDEPLTVERGTGWESVSESGGGT